ncbi:hypothetical protein NLJ89_g11053 [Agrocybe chaxingu]|uniref:non-specific serine/threonine protein kinase n=1 Tax=Agrocybe chaxingu TaxID=84603 RepID=A0A9W8MPQ3_9AGAR|nr:hypothetical protein NLJ89_g11053 [Agrocybe chaxingu]
MSTTTNSAKDDEELTLTFPEEPLGLPASMGFGFFQGSPQDVLGPGGRFQLQAKLGFGTNSSVWLAKDQHLGRHVALKILTGYASRLNAENLLCELAVHKRLASLPANETEHCNRLIAHFVHKGIEEDGDHLCLALELERSTLKHIWRGHNFKFLPIPIVKRVLRHLLHGLAALHKCGVAHTDIKPDNIAISLSPSWADETVSHWALAHRPRVYEPCQSLNKVVTNAFISERFPAPSLAELETCNFKISDFGNAQELDHQTTDDITPLTLRSPEVILGGPWDEKVDIWTFGCLIFTVLTKVALFTERVQPVHLPFLRPGIRPNADGLEVDYTLWLMATFTAQRFPPIVLGLYPNSHKHFENNGDMKRFASFQHRPLEMCIRDTGCPASDEDVAGACSLIRRCLKLNPSARPSALELLQDPWLVECSV